MAANELNELNDTELENRLREFKEELFNLRFQNATGQLAEHGPDPAGPFARSHAAKRSSAREIEAAEALLAQANAPQAREG